jgi:hypothetical protein
MVFVQELLRPFVSQLGGIREGLGAERVRLRMAEERIATLGAELETLREPRESPETVAEEREMAESPRSAVESQEPVRRAWWRRMFGG